VLHKRRTAGFACQIAVLDASAASLISAIATGVTKSIGVPSQGNPVHDNSSKGKTATNGHIDTRRSAQFSAPATSGEQGSFTCCGIGPCPWTLHGPGQQRSRNILLRLFSITADIALPFGIGRQHFIKHSIMAPVS